MELRSCSAQYAAPWAPPQHDGDLMISPLVCCSSAQEEAAAAWLALIVQVPCGWLLQQGEEQL